MLVLAIDTSGKSGSIALARTTPGPSDVEIVEVVPRTGGAFSAQLVPQIAALLEKHKHSKNDLEAFAVATGPGSFTGLRVGLAAIKALAEALRKPIAAISLLEAVAWSSTAWSGRAWSSTAQGAARGRVLAALDAGRGDVYVGDYELAPQLRMHSERLLSRDEFIAIAKGATVVTPDAALAEMVRAAGVHVERIEYPGSAVIARMGWEHLKRGQTVRPEELEANYIRHSDAEIFSKPKA